MVSLQCRLRKLFPVRIIGKPSVDDLISAKEESIDVEGLVKVYNGHE